MAFIIRPNPPELPEARGSVTLVPRNQTIRRHIPQDRNPFPEDFTLLLPSFHTGVRSLYRDCCSVCNRSTSRFV